MDPPSPWLLSATNCRSKRSSFVRDQIDRFIIPWTELAEDLPQWKMHNCIPQMSISGRGGGRRAEDLWTMLWGYKTHARNDPRITNGVPFYASWSLSLSLFSSSSAGITTTTIDSWNLRPHHFQCIVASVLLLLLHRDWTINGKDLHLKARRGIQITSEYWFAEEIRLWDDFSGWFEGEEEAPSIICSWLTRWWWWLSWDSSVYCVRSPAEDKQADNHLLGTWFHDFMAGEHEFQHMVFVED